MTATFNFSPLLSIHQSELFSYFVLYCICIYFQNIVFLGEETREKKKRDAGKETIREKKKIKEGEKNGGK